MTSSLCLLPGMTFSQFALTGELQSNVCWLSDFSEARIVEINFDLGWNG